MDDSKTPLLHSIDDSDTEENHRNGAVKIGEVSFKEKASTENVVNIVASKPTFVYVILMFGLMSFHIMCAMVVFFPNFGGYVPYSDWRCEPASEDCYYRTSKFVDQGWKTWSKNVPVFINNRCSIKLKKFDPTSDSPTLELWENATTHLGSITFNVSDARVQKILVKSMIECRNGAEICTKEFSFDLRTDLENMKCKLTFAGSSWTQKNTTLICDSTKIALTNDEGVLSAIHRVKYTKLNRIGSYNFHCPDKEQYNRDNLCGTGDDSKTKGQLNVGKDFYWYTQGRTSFAIDWDLYCDREYLRSMICSVYFCGAWIGTLVGGTLYDIIGRKRGALIGYAIVISSSFVLSASPSVEFLSVCRFLQGIGVFLGFTGTFVLLLEYTATKYRSIANSAILFFWAVGYLMVTLTGYLIKDWHWLASTSGFICLTIALIPLLITPESPRFLLVTKKNTERAKGSLKWLAKLNKSNFDVDSVVLEDIVEKTEDTTFIGTLKDFWRYKEMQVQLVIQMWLWMVSAFIYYGFSFSWSSLGSDIYISYLYAAIGEVIAYIAMIYPIEYWGRKPSIAMFYIVGSASFLVAMIPYKIGLFTVEQLSCLIGSMFVSAVFGSIFLYTMELAPTSHRGKMLGYCSFSARIGAFCGPQASLMFGWSKTGTLIIFAVLSGLAGLATFRLPETKDVPTPNSAEEVQLRRSSGVNNEASETVIKK